MLPGDLGERRKEIKKTLSEKLFEDYCKNSGIVYRRIPEENGRTPDYELMIDDQKIVVEVKEITPNKEEREALLWLAKKKGVYYKTIGGTPGGRVRKKISESSKQIKARTQGIYPSILVLFDSVPLSSPFFPNIGHLSGYDISVAMYGLQQIHFDIPRDRSIGPYPTGMSHGPKRKMTEEDNTSISAIGVLFRPGQNQIELWVFRNKFAAVPLAAGLLSKHGIRQFELDPANVAEWKEIEL